MILFFKRLELDNQRDDDDILTDQNDQYLFPCSKTQKRTQANYLQKCTRLFLLGQNLVRFSFYIQNCAHAEPINLSKSFFFFYLKSFLYFPFQTLFFVLETTHKSVGPN